MRTVFLMGALALTASIAFAGEVLIFTDGSRMEVRHYEIRDDIVVITTLDGKLVSVPISYLVIGEKLVGRSAPSDPRLESPVAPRAVPDRLVVSSQVAKARQALAFYGVERLVLRLQTQVEEELRAMAALLTPEEHQLLCATARRRFEAKRILDAAAMSLAEQAQDGLLDSWIDWFQSPLAQRILDAKSPAANDAAPPASPHRVDLMKRLDEALGASETGLEMRLAAATAIQDILPDHVQREDLETLRTRWSDSIREATEKELLFSYRGACDDDLWGYLTYWQSLPGRRFAELSRAAFLSGVHSVSQAVQRAQTE